MTPSVSNTYYASLEAPRLTTEVPEDNDVLPETVTDSTKPEDVRKPRRKGRDTISTAGGTKLTKMAFLGTNLYGRPYCPGRPLSMAERRRIIELHMSGMKVNAISKTLCISHGCVSKIISRYRQTGILSPASSPEQRRTRRKKNESPPAESQEYKPEFKHDYSHPEYVTHDFRVHYAAQPHPAEMAMPHYTMIPEQMLVPDYSQPVLL
ncbi:paired box' domain protein [Ancylostoma ceylanicum]|uniref:Paired box' domain protein n=1 Tax=Ancylostoma ceylanicum TaxID=53326 RepID=A0A0D6MAE3_9BILA|nr:paired box' domain protein [Ancylostoma ceylanicum]